MTNRENIKTLMNDLQAKSNREIHFDEESIIAAYEEKDTNHQSLSIKILSIFGGLMACLTFLGFIFMIDIINSPTSAGILGIICIAGSCFVSKVSGKTIIDTLSVSFFITGFTLVGLGLFEEGDTIYPVLIALALCALLVAQSYILSFISILTINGSIFAFAHNHDIFNLISAIIIVQTIIITFLFLQEAKIITKNKMLSKLYDPVRTGMVFSFIFTLAFLGFESSFHLAEYYYDWTSSVVIALAILYVISVLFRTLHVTNITYKILIYVLVVLFLLPTLLLTPTISGAILIILLSFLVNYKTGFVLAVIALISFLGRFYYDLQFTLLIKSILLFASGIIFLAIYFFTRKKLTTHEKI